MGKGIVLFFLIGLIFCIQKQGNVLILHDADFPHVLNQNQQILIMFSAPWCNHCQNLQPVFSSIADKFQSTNSQILFGKVDTTINPNITEFYNIEGFPKFIFFENGQLIEYEGQRNEYHLTLWLQKIQNNPLIPIGYDAYQNLEKIDKSSVIFHGNPYSEEAKIVKKVALTDTVNDFYIMKPQNNKTFVQMIRPLHEKIICERVDQNLKEWIRKNEKHIVVPFNDRAIAQVFNENKTAVFLFNEKGSQQLTDQFTKSAKQYLKQGKQMLFAHVEKNGEHMSQFSQFLNISPSQTPIVLVDISSFTKSVLRKYPSQLTQEEISKFLQRWQQGNEKKYEVSQKLQLTLNEKKENLPDESSDDFIQNSGNSPNQQNQDNKKSQSFQEIEKSKNKQTQNTNEIVQKEL